MKNYLTKIADLVTSLPCRPRVKKLPGRGLSLVLAALMLLGALRQAAAQGTAFTYQGQLNNNGNPANGNYDLRFSLFTVPSGGSLAYGFLTNSATAVSNGLFTVTLDFGAGVFGGTTYWMQIGVRTNGTGGFSALSPRQELTPAPYAIFAEGASAGGLSGTIPMANLSGIYGNTVNFTNPANSFAGDGSALTGVSASTLGGLASSSFWKTTGNAGTSPGVNFLGTTDNEALGLRANNQTGLQLQYWSAGSILSGSINDGINIIGGFSGNTTSNNANGVTIAGGGYLYRSTLIFPPYSISYPNVVTGDFGTIGGGFANTAGTNATVGGGQNNLASGTGSSVGGGLQNTNRAIYGTIGGGNLNTADGTTGGFLSGGSTVAGGEGNKASTDLATVGGGIFNTASGVAATVPGGSANVAGGYGSFAAGQSAQTTHSGTFIWGDGSQTFTGAPADNAFNVLASGGVFFYDGGNGVHLDAFGNNNGTLDYGLRFGGALASGEGIASKRTAGGNQYGLDFYTASANRMSIDVNGATRVYDNDIYLRTTADSNHDGLAYRSSVAGIFFDGPFLWGYQGGALGTVVPNEVSLKWDFSGNVWISNNCSVATLTIRGGADVAEPFEISAVDNQVPPGSVVVIDEENPGRLKISSGPYDTRVAGVVSGANGINPGIQMQQQGLLDGGKNVALTGRVYVQADARDGAIRPGDLLTTSSTPGHAMKVADHAKAQGAILGKAMTSLKDGKGMVLVLVTLQ